MDASRSAPFTEGFWRVGEEACGCWQSTWRNSHFMSMGSAQNEELEFDASAAQPQVLCPPPISALDPLRDPPIIRRWTGADARPSSDDNRIASDREIVDHQSRGIQAVWPKSLPLLADSFWKPASEQLGPAAKLQTRASTRFHTQHLHYHRNGHDPKQGEEGCEAGQPVAQGGARNPLCVVVGTDLLPIPLQAGSLCPAI